MTVAISPKLIWFCIHVIGWTLAVAVFTVIFYAVLCFVVRCLRRRRVFGMARLYLTTKDQRNRANEYTYHQLSEVAEILKQDNPEMFKRVGRLFSEDRPNN